MVPITYNTNHFFTKTADTQRCFIIIRKKTFGVFEWYPT